MNFFLVTAIILLLIGCNQTNDELCNPNPCTLPHKTVCSVENDKSICSCEEGFIPSGAVCVKAENCENNPCGNNSDCFVTNNQVTCTCKENYIEINDICIFDCSGKLNSKPNTTNDGCVCIEGYEEDDSEICIKTSFDACNPNTCTEEHKSICVDYGTGFECYCESGYTLINNVCEKNENPCQPNPCTEENRTTCVATGTTINDFKCNCNIGWKLENDVCVVDPMPSGCQKYSALMDLTSSQIISELNRMTGIGYTSIGYSTAGDLMYDELDNVNGKNQCVYTGNWHTAGSGVNCEHTWPQSMGASGDAKSDIHHLYPTENSVNSSRGNLPFGIPVSGIDEYCNDDNTYCSKRGENANGADVFEPANQHKGNVARSMYYFAVRYNNPSNFIKSQNQQALFKEWNILDPVDQRELDRNSGIERYQHNRNPFVDCPQLMDKITF